MKKVILLIIGVMLLSACSNNTIRNSNNSAISQGSKNLEEAESKVGSSESTSPKNKYTKHIEVSIDKNLMLENLKSISLYSRKFGTEGENNSFNYLKCKLEEYGYITETQDFPVYKQDSRSTHVKYYSDYFKINPYNLEPVGTAKNIIAKRDIHTETKKTIYLTAHYDTTANTAGVIDNGSGVVVVLEVARQLAYYECPFNIEIVLFSAEEYFRTGSRIFVSDLSEKEKQNIIGCINVDMVGEKGAGNIDMNIASIEQNILTLMFNHYQEKKLLVSDGGTSDDLSFYLGKIPAITLANNNPDPSRHKEKNELQYIDFDELQDTARLIINFLLNYESSTWNEFLNNRNITSNVNANAKRIAVDAFKQMKNSAIDGFSLNKVNAKLLENGYDCETEYIYENKEGKKYVVVEKFAPFINPNTYSNFMTLESSYKNSNSFKCLYRINENSNINSKVFYIISNYFGEIKGDMTSDEVINVLKACYREKYKSIFGE